MAQFLQRFQEQAAGLQRTAGPAIAQAAQTYGPLVAQGVKQGVKQGLMSLRDPKKSAYSTFNSVAELALAPGNIQEEIRANLNAAAARSKSQTPFLNEFAGPGAGNRLHRAFYGKPNAAKFTPVMTPFPRAPNAATMARWKTLAAQPVPQFGDYTTPQTPAAPTPQMWNEYLKKEEPQKLMGGKRRRTRRTKRKQRKTRRRR